MGWPYEFLDLTPEEKQARRLVLDRYGHYATFLVLLPSLIALGVRAYSWVQAQGRLRYGSPDRSGGGAYDAVPDSPSLKQARLAARGSWAAWRRQVRWWLSDDVVLFGQPYGQRDQWVVGAAWLALSLVLCVVETGRDYMHLTKRFGIVAVSQFPFQYLLVLKSGNPLVPLFRSSHEELNRWHRVLGAIIYTLLALHTAFYLNFFYHNGGILPRLVRPVIVLGLTSFTGMTLLSTTALAAVRRWSYRVFFITHVAVAIAVPSLILFHAHSARPYMAAALVLLGGNLALRKVYTFTTEATVERVPGTTNLVKLSAPLPYDQLDRFRKHPGSHVYMSLPYAARPSPSPLSLSFYLWEFVFNPFTIASVSERTGDLTLVVRTHEGPLTGVLAKHSRTRTKEQFSEEDDADADDADESTPAILDTRRPLGEESRPTGKIAVNIEGPYGTSAHFFPELSPKHVDRVLLVAGGVGATFTVPLYRALTQEHSGVKVDMVWSVRGAGDATWAVVEEQEGGSGDGSGVRNLLADPNVHIFLTGADRAAAAAGGSTGMRRTRESSAAEAAVELDALHRANGGSNGHGHHHHHRGSSRSRLGLGIGGSGNRQQRPDLRQVVDDVFRHGSEERVAVLACGPEAMVRDLRAAVAPWVAKGRSVWWHNESFGW